jgi:hypothetical protein
VQNVIGSSATQAVKDEAVADLVQALGSGMSRADVIYTVFGNLANMPKTDAKYGGVAQLFANQLVLAKTYTEVMEQSTTDLQTLRSVLDAATASSSTRSQDEAVDLILQGLLGDEPDPTAGWLRYDPIF